jgi:release factor glutamine methyltransferase
MGATLHEQIAQARQTLIASGLSAPDAAVDAEVLARHVLGWDRATLLVRGREPASPDFSRRFDALIERRAAREPVAFITGHREFWGREFEVTRDVLIPRPETELIVEVVLDRTDAARKVRILDVGTGSGCLAVTLAIELPAADVLATDGSASALHVAERNAVRHGVQSHISFVQGDLLDPVSGPFDIVVCNPPYVPTSAELPVDISRYEPASALFAGGMFVVEFGFGQAAAVRALAGAAGWSPIDVRADLQGIPRVCVMGSIDSNVTEG